MKNGIIDQGGKEEVHQKEFKTWFLRNTYMCLHNICMITRYKPTSIYIFKSAHYEE